MRSSQVLGDASLLLYMFSVALSSTFRFSELSVVLGVLVLTRLISVLFEAFSFRVLFVTLFIALFDAPLVGGSLGVPSTSSRLAHSSTSSRLALFDEFSFRRVLG